jgi:hypothetical protein
LERGGSTNGDGNDPVEPDEIVPPEPDEPEPEPDELGDWETEPPPDRIWAAESLDNVLLGPFQLMALRFQGEGIERRGVDLRLFSELMTALNRLLTGLQPVAAGLRVELGGQLPRLPGVSPPLLQGAGSGRSITVVLALAGDEARLVRESGGIPPEMSESAIPQPGEVSQLPTRHDVSDYSDVAWASRFPTVRAASWVTEILGANPDVASHEIQALGRRATRDYLNLGNVVTKHEVDTYARTRFGHKQVAAPSNRFLASVQELRRTEEQTHETLRVKGVLYQADAKNHRFRLITQEAQSILGTYVPDMLEVVRSSWANVVDAEILRIDYRWMDAERPHKSVYQLQRVLRTYDDEGADEFLAHVGE